MKSTSFIRGTAIAATLGTMLVGAALFALPAAANTSASSSDYDYHEGLSGDDGSMLLATNAAATYTGDSAATPEGDDLPSAQASVSAAPTADQINAESVPAASPTLYNAASTAPSVTGYSAAELIGWGTLAVAGLLALAAVWSFVIQDRTNRRKRTITTHVYQH